MPFEESVEGHKELSLQICSFSLRMQCTKLGENLDGFVRIRRGKNCNECNIEAYRRLRLFRLSSDLSGKNTDIEIAQIFATPKFFQPRASCRPNRLPHHWYMACDLMPKQKGKKAFKLLNSRGIKSGFESCEQKVVAKQNFVMIWNTFGPSHFHPETSYQATQTSQTQDLSKFRDPNVAARPTLPKASQADQQARIGCSKSRFSRTENIVRYGNIMILYKLRCLRL